MAAAAITHIVCTRRPAVRKDYIEERLKKPANNTCRFKNSILKEGSKTIQPLFPQLRFQNQPDRG